MISLADIESLVRSGESETLELKRREPFARCSITMAGG